VTDDVAAAVAHALRQLVQEEVARELGRRRLDPEWLMLEEAADRYRTTPAALRARARRGTLPGAVKDGSRWLVDATVLDAALAGASRPQQ
jgi:hypothetical protein